MTMNITTEQLAELLAGIARSQQAVIDAVDRAQPGFRGTYLLPTLNVAANLRIPEVRLLDLPSRILLRSQGRVPMDMETVMANLHAALGQTPAAPNAPTAKAPLAAPAASTAAAPAIGGDAESDFFNS
jgi:hypothetical protein